MAVSTSEDVEKSREVFAAFDRDDSGTIETQQLGAALQLLGLHTTLEELFATVSQVDRQVTGVLDFNEFLKVVDKARAASVVYTNEASTLEAFAALGGKADKTGTIPLERLAGAIKEFDLAVDMTPVLAKLNTPNAELDYNGFKALLGE
ncbi:hypothetical protein WJX73_006225 [Symbiochloris irregularis]|uniref:EF-hand domain-containing protein n=1 Tax=Symbiochloris irregularis TaxID=706552 RepID=A0AAW1PIP4_9CHLO